MKSRFFCFFKIRMFIRYKYTLHNHLKTNWELLKVELTEAFEDPTMREEWRSNFKAYKWDEENTSLQTYCANVQRYVDAYDTHLTKTPVAQQQQYYIINFIPCN